MLQLKAKAPNPYRDGKTHLARYQKQPILLLTVVCHVVFYHIGMIYYAFTIRLRTVTNKQ